ncbi:Uncharacterized protein PECH_000981 [Penicillium ucsense]|uniref:Letm1 RBD domain-containing protein n=1 Tax=Penicillium ucsense TaxID=2839758 RepID=A0A8J8W1C1_9EURO|nr:Uncharacterized protein PECM_006666 [Penicillium ucsense]KAF7733201.1 Uncharacterized protein PECH_000981 [Penicillium ucsense]
MASIAKGNVPLWNTSMRSCHRNYTSVRHSPLPSHHHHQQHLLYKSTSSPFSTSATLHAHVQAQAASKERPRVRSSTQPTKSITPRASAPTLDTLTHTHINAPISTFPAHLDTPDSLPASASAPEKLKRLVAVGRAYLTFYKTGLKNVYYNYRAAIPIRRELGLPKYLPVVPPRRRNGSSPANSGDSNADASMHPELKLGRGRFQLVRRSARDVQRMIPFTLILIVCGEFTPLVIPIFGSAITPATCRVPGQVAKDREAGSKRRVLALQAFAAGTGKTVPMAGSDAERAMLVDVSRGTFAREASAQQVLQVCAMFGLVKTHDRVLGTAMAGLVYRPRLVRYLHYLEVDDRMIMDAGVDALSADEVRLAVEERGGGDVAAMMSGLKAETREREWLKKWLMERRALG